MIPSANYPFWRAPLLACLISLPAFLGPVSAEEHSVWTALGNTTLSGYVDTSATWVFGAGALVGPPIAGSDDFAERPQISHFPATLVAVPDQTLAESQGPEISPLGAGPATWWTWTAPGTGSLILDAGLRGDTAMAAFSGKVLGSLIPVGDNSRPMHRGMAGTPTAVEGWGLARFVTVDVESGQELQLAVAYVEPIRSPGPRSINPVFVPPGQTLSAVAFFFPAPLNDTFAQAKPLRGSVSNEPASTLAARAEAAGPDPEKRTTWYRWTAPQTGLATLSTAPIAALTLPQALTLVKQLPAPRYDWPEGLAVGSELWLVPTNSAPGSGSPWNSSGGGVSSTVNTTISGIGMVFVPDAWREIDPPPQFDPVFTVFTGDHLESLQVVGQGTNFSFRVEVGRTYAIQLASPARAMGVQTFNLEVVTPPNDSFGDRLPLIGAVAVASGFTLGAGTDPGEPSGVGHTTWWTWTAPESGDVSFAVSSGDFNPQGAVYRGTTLGSLATVTGPGDRLKWVAEAGAAYEIAIGSSNGREGSYNMALELHRFAPRVISHEARTVPDGSFRLGLDRLYGRPIRLLFTSDLITWQPLWHGRFNADEAVVRDFSTGTEPRFYRVELDE